MWERACVFILPFFQDLQVIPKKDSAILEKQVAFWLNIDF